MKSNTLRILAFCSVIVLLGAGLALAGIVAVPKPQAAELHTSSHPIPKTGRPSNSPRPIVEQTPPPSQVHESHAKVTDPPTTSVPNTDPPTTYAPTTIPEPVVISSTTAPLPPPVVVTTAVRVGTVITGEVSFTNPVVDAGTSLVFDPSSNATLRVTGNLTVLGTLVMHPNSDVTHRIVFEDRGEMLVTVGGLLDIQGTPKVAWNRTGSDPSWRGGDELVVAPIAPGDWSYHPFSLGNAVPTYQGFAAEVANLTRNVIIDNPSRIMLHGLDGHGPQVIKYATISNAGVRDKLGFYALHFHLNGNATRGSIVEGVVVRDSQFRAFVPHGSNGITFRDTLAVNVVANGYWWDLNRASDPPSPVNQSNDILYERAGVIGLSTSSPPDQQRQAGFNLGDGSGNVIRDSFVAGLSSGPDNSGFQWPAAASAVWSAQNLVAHNNMGHGFFVWQNGAEPHVISGIVSYLNGGAGISQGAYANSYAWFNVKLIGNAVGVFLNTFSRSSPYPRQTFQCITIMESPVGVLLDTSPVKDGESTLFRNLVIQGVANEFVLSEKAMAEGQTLELRTELIDYQTAC